MIRRYLPAILILIGCILCSSCSVTKYVPDGAYLLDEVRVTTDNSTVSPNNLKNYVRQNPNSKWFSLFRMQLHVYSLSGRDSSKWVNRFLRRIGDAPVVFSNKDADRSKEEIQKAVRNMGYMGAIADYSVESKKKKRLKLHYHVKTGKPYTIHSISFDVPDAGISDCLRSDSINSLLKEGMLFDVNILDAERQRVTDLLLSKGYYKFNKDNIYYTADTVRNTCQVGLTFHLKAPQSNLSSDYLCYRIGKVGFVTDFDMLRSSALSSIEVNDSIHYKGYPIYYKDNLYLRPSVLVNNLRFSPGELYDEDKVQRTYANFGRLSALKYSNIRFFEDLRGDTVYLNSYVMLTKNKDKAMEFEVEGTNSAGDLGAAASISFQHRNLFRGSELFTIKLRGAYEAITGLQGDYGNNNYTEYGVETTLNFPSFLFPFLSSDFKRNIRATTEFGVLYNFQLRPEFSRTMASASWSYRWSQPRMQHKFDLIDVAYLYLPWISNQFREDYINKGQNYIFEYNYQNRLIVHTGYSLLYSNSGGLASNRGNASSFSIRFNIESAGNLLYGFSKLVNMRKNDDGEYSILNIPYAQYVKLDFDYAQKVVFDERNTLAFHAAAGVAVPYGNAKTIPFEKQYFSGGANSVRGWSVRGLGPGSFAGDGNLLNQSGDIRLDASIEYRSKLFWKIFGAVFVDAGNIWTIRNYENQPGGAFAFDKFYRQIALSYGFGLRLDLDFFVLRFDGGMKALNPMYESGPERWPIIHPVFSRDFAFHFAVGYPF